MNAKRDGQIGQGAMTAATSDRMVASDYLMRAENLLAGQAQRTVEDNRAHVARVLRISEATCQNIRRGRRKIVPGWLKEKIVGLFIDAAQLELMALEHEIIVARQIGLGNSDSKLLAARARAANLVSVLDSISSEGAGASAP
jgi:hypothetical protein